MRRGIEARCLCCAALCFALVAARAGASCRSTPAPAPPSRSICCWCWPPTSRAASTHQKFQLQREGYAAAISDPRVLNAIKSGPQQPHRGLLRRMVRLRRAEGRDRLDHDRRAADRAQFGDRCWKRRARSPTAPRSAAASTSRSRSLRARRSRPRGAPSTSPATAPTIPAATSGTRATRPWRRASPSTAW